MTRFATLSEMPRQVQVLQTGSESAFLPAGLSHSTFYFIKMFDSIGVGVDSIRKLTDEGSTKSKKRLRVSEKADEHCVLGYVTVYDGGMLENNIKIDL
jgi:hypothetical protein